MRNERTIIILLLVAVFAGRASLSLRSDANIASRVFNDDSFYLESASMHLAHGEGLSVDGKHPTNGIQPLIVLLHTPMYMVAGNDRWLGLRLSMVFDALIDTVSALLLYLLVKRIAKSPSAPIAALAIWAFAYPILEMSANGLETGLYTMFMLACSLLYLQRIGEKERSLTSDLLFGIALGLLVLSRIDGVFFVLCYLALEWKYEHQRPVMRILLPSITACIISLPWWLYNVTVFGSIMPTSGAAESIGGASLITNLERLIVALADIISVLFVTQYYTTPVWMNILWCAVIISVAIALFIRFDVPHILKDTNIRSILPLLYVGALFAVVYTFFFHAPYFIPRYLQPLRVFMVIVASIVLTSARMKEVPKYIVYLLRTIYVAGLVFFAIRCGHNFFATGIADIYEAGRWAEAHPYEKIGMQQSGTVGFISDNVINLDGKVNADVLEALKHHQRGAYIAQSGITYLMDWNDFVSELVNEADSAGAHFERADSIGAILKIYKRAR